MDGGATQDGDKQAALMDGAVEDPSINLSSEHPQLICRKQDLCQSRYERVSVTTPCVRLKRTLHTGTSVDPAEGFICQSCSITTAGFCRPD
uniref:Uncharacterized protein n=1 Tax=Knipowitschia caucasica TaxID=637954 RepID=A0AAV2LB23_KNICA